MTSSLYLDYGNDETAAGVNSVEIDFGSLGVGQEVSWHIFIIFSNV